jgi:ATPase subunit of ABC transporter with duplicated ATPase domains
MLEINNLTIEVNNKEIIKNLNLVINKNDKIAIIGEEGNGKSTLLKAIMNTCSYADIKGYINYKNNTIGYLEQSISDDDLNKTVKTYLFADDEDYYMKINNLYKYLKELQLNEDILNSIIFNLSGGEKVKIQLLKILLKECDILILDEPTNDLDLESLLWLENFIIKCEKPILFVSHDETLLSKTANAILHLEMLKAKTEPKWTFERISYDEYVKKRISGITHQTQVANYEQRQYKKQKEKLTQIMNKVHYQLNTISRGDPHGAKLLKKKMKVLKSQEKRFENQEFTETPDYEEGINFFFDEAYIPNRKQIVDIKNMELKIGNRILSKNVTLSINSQEHVVIIGRNGVGKTTLLKQIYDKIKDRTDIKTGYMPQDYSEMLKHFKTPIDFLCNNMDKDEISLVRSYMGNMKFTRTEMVNDINELSGGSKAKLIILKLVLNKYNVLILDEPTRNVSPLSNPIIRSVLKEFKGVIISVSHDRKYINEVCDSIYELTPECLIEKH